MKKLALGVAALSMLALVSCKKDYTCTCTASVSGVTTGTTETTINDTKKNAEEACNESNGTSTAGGFTTTTSCVLSE